MDHLDAGGRAGYTPRFDVTDGPDPDDPDRLDDRVLLTERELADLDAERRDRADRSLAAERRVAAAFGALEAAFERLSAGGPDFAAEFAECARAAGELRACAEDQLPADDDPHGAPPADAGRGRHPSTLGPEPVAVWIPAHDIHPGEITGLGDGALYGADTFARRLYRRVDADDVPPGAGPGPGPGPREG